MYTCMLTEIPCSQKFKLANDFAVTVKKQNHNTLYNNMSLVASPNFHPLCDFNHRRCCLMSLSLMIG